MAESRLSNLELQMLRLLNSRGKLNLGQMYSLTNSNAYGSRAAVRSKLRNLIHEGYTEGELPPSLEDHPRYDKRYSFAITSAGKERIS